MTNYINHQPRVICISGGIGSGKSVVCRLLEAMGYPVYDCDSRARQIMDNTTEIKELISEKISSDVIDSNGQILRERLSQIVFSNPEKLAILNSIVHAAIRMDIAEWKHNQANSKHLLFVESAIPFTSGLDTIVDIIWEVTAPVDVRIERIVKRNNCTEAHATARIASQQAEESLSRSCSDQIHYIINDGTASVISQVLELLKQ